MEFLDKIKRDCLELVNTNYEVSFLSEKLVLTETKKDFEGDYTIVVFPFTSASKKNPEATGEEIGQWLLDRNKDISSYNVIGGFLNLSIASSTWIECLTLISSSAIVSNPKGNGQKIMVEFSSPNTNKPLHLGHIRNILLGWSTNRIFEANGYDVIKTQICNDRGIAICKSMVAWNNYANGATPESEKVKGDAFVGQYYVKFQREVEKEYSAWLLTEDAQKVFKGSDKKSFDEFTKAYKNNFFNNESKLGAQAKDYLLKWEDGDEEIRKLWSTMNSWVYSGFDVTYKSLGVDFDKIYYESDTYILGKDIVDEGLEKKEFYKKQDGSVWVDLEKSGLDHKLILRSDGTSVYMTQDLGTAEVRYQDYGVERMVYVVGNEQEYHFKVLFEILKYLNRSYADGLYHLSYGMVDLPTGRMKTREGTVVDADDLIIEMIGSVKQNSIEKGGLEGVAEEEKSEIYRKIAMSALKFFILKVNAKKGMVFNPEESVDLQGHTGPYVQNAYVRIQSILRKSSSIEPQASNDYTPNSAESQLIKTMIDFENSLQLACKNYDPSVIANWSYELAKQFHKMYHESPILQAEENAKAFRLDLVAQVARYLDFGFDLLGIEMPDRM